MKNKTAGIFGVLFLAMVTTAFAQRDGNSRLDGTWEVVVTPRGCATGNVITSFQAAYIFDAGGTFSGLSSGTGSGGRGREQLGIWKHLNGRNYRFRIKTYLFNADGIATSYQVVTHDAQLDNHGRNWSSVGISQTFSLDDVEINSGCSTIVAQRVADL